ncbi:uncharacterized protein LOC144037104 isoform X1 [Vanacampus margaritifer]
MMMMMLIIIVTVTSIGAHGSYSCQTPPAGHHKNCMVLRSPYRAACVQLKLFSGLGLTVQYLCSRWLLKTATRCQSIPVNVQMASHCPRQDHPSDYCWEHAE